MCLTPEGLCVKIIIGAQNDKTGWVGGQMGVRGRISGYTDRDCGEGGSRDEYETLKKP